MHAGSNDRPSAGGIRAILSVCLLIGAPALFAQEDIKHRQEELELPDLHEHSG